MTTQNAGAIVRDVTDQTFQTEVIDESRKRPVVVDFWAAWCGPCQVLGPTIEKVAAEFAGQILLAKLNVDENPQSAMQYRIQGIPAVKAFRNGQVVNEFTGALMEPQVRTFFQSLAPSEADRLAADANTLLAAGNDAAAEPIYRKLLEQTPDHPEAVLGLAQVLINRSEASEADNLLKRLPANRQAKVLRHRIFLEGYAARHQGEDLEAQARQNPKDPRARYRWGLMLATRERYTDALDELLESVRLDRNWEDGAARKSILAIFDILGLDSTITRDYQRRLENVLF